MCVDLTNFQVKIEEIETLKLDLTSFLVSSIIFARFVLYFDELFRESKFIEAGKIQGFHESFFRISSL